MGHGTRPPGARQAAPPLPSDGRLVALGRLFTLGRDGTITAAPFAPVRSKLTLALAHLDSLRYAAEDAVEVNPNMPPEAQHADVHEHGAAVYDALRDALDILDWIVVHLRQEEQRVS
jgi:hypothetical protein